MVVNPDGDDLKAYLRTFATSFPLFFSFVWSATTTEATLHIFQRRINLFRVHVGQLKKKKKILFLLFLNVLPEEVCRIW